MFLSKSVLDQVDDLIQRACNFDWTKRHYDFPNLDKNIEEKINANFRDLKEFFDKIPELANQNGLSQLADSLDIIRVPRVNVKTVSNGTEYEVEAPGFAKEDFLVEASDGKLHIKAEKKTSNVAEDDAKSYTKREFTTVSFNRSVALPLDANTTEISAVYKEGILTLFVPVAEKKEKSLIKVL